MQRPLVVFVLFKALGITGGVVHGEIYRYPISAETIHLWLAFTIITALLFYGGDKHLFPQDSFSLKPAKTLGRFLLYFILFGLSWYYSFQHTLIPQNYLLEENAPFSGTIVAINEKPHQLILDLRRPDGEKVRVKYTGPALDRKPVIGEKLSLSGQLYIPNQRRNPGSFDYQAYLWRQGISREMTLRSADDIVFLESSEGKKILEIIGNRAHSLREKMVAFVKSYATPTASAVIAGIIFGGQDQLTEEDREVFRITGVAHAFAVSGTAVGVLAGTVMVLLRGWRQWQLPIWTSIIITTTVLMFYGFMTAFPPSVQRAILMALGGLIAYGIQRKVDPPTILAAAALTILLYNPLMISDIGFQMSFGATWGILYFLPLFHQWMNRSSLSLYLKAPLAVLALSLSAQLAVAPLTIYYFNMLSLSGFVANLLAGLFIALIVIFGFVIFVLIFIWETGASWLLASLSLVVEAVTRILRQLATVPGSALTVATPSPLLILAYYMALILGREVFLNNLSPKILCRLQKSFLPASALFLSFIVLTSFFTAATVKVTFIDVGQGDSILIETPQGKRILIDAPGPVNFPQRQREEQSRESFWTTHSTARPYDPGEKILATYFRHKGVGHLDLVINTHADQDHIGGLLYLAQNFSIGQLVLSPPPKEVVAYEELKNIAELRNIPIWESPVTGKDISPDRKIALTVLYPLANTQADKINDSSIVLMLQYDQVKMLFTGDLEVEGQEALTSLAERKLIDLAAHVVKIPHHGSKYFNSTFVEETKAEIAVITVGRNNFGHPSPQAIEAWTSLGADLFRTDQHGAVLIESDGQRLWYQTVRFIENI
ncbi:DNA internalization-related competence protein ComEC/Rec2 [Heliorestis acidaminivorans]|uniref:DNA internalization-related competence protein ComEC/Rec2 n=1 Tax=Heliorestis acidaminivorans TaxID=553427 RepID=A0A6I0F008_9FIRM|nr:DNA internalization-related competence protein ComEC/Rec2 [Heliorestis acidaminivorans]KAB2952302.1 DNA internalization-related competence protein ComEC/Rec2 [Heliorestis acidaminivorans]